MLMPKSLGDAAELARTHALARAAEAQLADAFGLAAEFAGGGGGGAPAPAADRNGPKRLQRLGCAWEEAKAAWALADAATRNTQDPAAAESAAAITAASAEVSRATGEKVEEALAELRAHVVSAAEAPVLAARDVLRAQRPWKTNLTEASQWKDVVAEMEYTFWRSGKGWQSSRTCAARPSPRWKRA